LGNESFSTHVTNPARKISSFQSPVGLRYDTGQEKSTDVILVPGTEIVASLAKQFLHRQPSGYMWYISVVILLKLLAIGSRLHAVQYTKEPICRSMRVDDEKYMN